MSVNPLLTNYNATGGSLFAPASGGGGGGGGATTASYLTNTYSTVSTTVTTAFEVGILSYAPTNPNLSSFGFTNYTYVPITVTQAGSQYSDLAAMRIIVNGTGPGQTTNPPFTPGSTLPYLDFNAGIKTQTDTVSTCIFSVNSGNPAQFQIDLNGTTNGQRAVFQTMMCAPVTNGGYALQINSSNCAAFGSNYALMSFSDTPSVLAQDLFYTIGVLGANGDPFLIKGNAARSNTSVSFQTITSLDASGADLKISTINGAAPGGGTVVRSGFALVAPTTASLTVNISPPAATNGWYVIITPVSNPGALTYWATSINTTSFSINLSAGATGPGLAFYWHAIAN
jgi:hypothetical protein